MPEPKKDGGSSTLPRAGANLASERRDRANIDSPVQGPAPAALEKDHGQIGKVGQAFIAAARDRFLKS
jgi:hypothetical protein